MHHSYSIDLQSSLLPLGNVQKAIFDEGLLE